MSKYEYIKNGEVCKIYDYTIYITTVDGGRHLTVEAETPEEATKYAKNIICNNEPFLIGSPMHVKYIAVQNY